MSSTSRMLRVDLPSGNFLTIRVDIGDGPIHDITVDILSKDVSGGNEFIRKRFNEDTLLGFLKEKKHVRDDSR